MANITAATKSFHFSYRFAVQIDGVTRGTFATCSDIQISTEDIEHFEGGSMRAYKAPGRITVDDVTLERGVIDNDSDLYNWFKEVADAAIDSPLGAGIGTGIGLDDEAFKRDVDIVQLSRSGVEKRRIRLRNAYPKSVKLASFDNSSDEVTMENVVLRYDFPEEIPVQV
jgi:phage tail-like protein